MKFRIVEQRGVFRIHERRLKQPKYKESWITGRVVKTGLKDVWEELCDDIAYINQGFLRGVAMKSPAYFALEFDTYKKAENHIKKFYGSNGVDAIEKPEWRTV